MPFTVREFSDLVNIINTMPEWRSQLRRALFPEVDLPKALQALAEAQARTEAGLQRLEALFAELRGEQKIQSQDILELKSDVKVLKSDVNELKSDVKVLKSDVNELKSDVKVLKSDVNELKSDVKVLKSDVNELKSDVKVLKSDVNELKSDFKVLKGDVKRLDVGQQRIRQDVSELKGKVHESFYRDKANAVFGYYLRNGRDMTSQIADQLHEAIAAGTVPPEQFHQVMAADLLWGGRERVSGDELVLVIEASWVAEATDIERAAQRATILRQIGLKALPVVAGREWSDIATKMAGEQGVVMTTNGTINHDSWPRARAKHIAHVA